MAVIGHAAHGLQALARTWHREDGQGMAEYALILLFVAVACVAAFTLFGNAVNTAVNSVATKF